MVSKSLNIRKNNNPNLKKLKLLITIVDRNKALFYIDFFEQYQINMQMVCYGHGTADSEMLHYLGLASNEKAVILSAVKEEVLEDLLPTLNEKFNTVKNGKGIAFVVPFKSVIGVATYQFLVNEKLS